MNSLKPGIISGLILSAELFIGIVVAFSIVMTFADIPDEIVRGISGLIPGAVSYAAAYASTQTVRNKGLVQGAILGGLFLIITVLLGLIFNGLVSESCLIKAGACFVAGILGGVIGVNTRKTKLSKL